MLYNYGEILRSEFPRFKVLYSSATDVWRVIDLHHESLTTISDPDGDIPDNSPAVTVLPGLMVRSLLEEMRRLGMISGGEGEGEVVGIPREGKNLKLEAMSKILEVLDKSEGAEKTEITKFAISKLSELAGV